MRAWLTRQNNGRAGDRSGQLDRRTRVSIASVSGRDGILGSALVIRGCAMKAAAISCFALIAAPVAGTMAAKAAMSEGQHSARPPRSIIGRLWIAYRSRPTTRRRWSWSDPMIGARRGSRRFALIHCRARLGGRRESSQADVRFARRNLRLVDVSDLGEIHRRHSLRTFARRRQELVRAGRRASRSSGDHASIRIDAGRSNGTDLGRVGRQARSGPAQDAKREYRAQPSTTRIRTIAARPGAAT